MRPPPGDDAIAAAILAALLNESDPQGFVQVDMTQVMSFAGVAGAAGVASMAGAPFPLDLTAPAFGASMAAEALGFASMASLAVGTNMVPDDMIAQIHPGERIIPAADNRDIMAAIRGAGATQAAGGGSSLGAGRPSGDKTVNLAISAMDSRDVRRQFSTPRGQAILRGMMEKLG